MATGERERSKRKVKMKEFVVLFFFLQQCSDKNIEDKLVPLSFNIEKSLLFFVIKRTDSYFYHFSANRICR